MKAHPVLFTLLLFALHLPLHAELGNVTEEEKKEAAEVKAYRDPYKDQIKAVYQDAQNALDLKEFDKLEEMAAKFRSPDEVFGDGYWKSVSFYSALPPKRKEPEEFWQKYEGIFKEWMAAKPESVAARIGYAEFLTEYAWKARGTGYSNTVTQEGWKLMRERLALAKATLDEAKALGVEDPGWYKTSMTTALGQGPSLAAYQELVAAAHKAYPTMWQIDVARAYSLLPRWYGEKGDWEKFAAETAARPDGLGDADYARIVMRLRSFYGNIFEESSASWEQTKKGLEAIRKSYPDSYDIATQAAILAVQAGDQAYAKQLFDHIGDRYVWRVWRSKEKFVDYRNWANTGKW